ncbi:hypothetical protein vseg_021008 [Gypsophila vaccaria]
MIEVEVGKDLPSSLYFKDEKRVEISIIVEYEWKPVVCSLCKGIGHEHEMCRKKKVPPPVVKPVVKPNNWVWRPKPKPPAPNVMVSGLVTPNQPVILPGGGSHTATPATALTLITRQECHVGNAATSPSASYAEAIRSGSPTKTGVGGPGVPNGNGSNG